MRRTGRRIGVLLGGLSSERELSRASGESVLAALRERGHTAEALFVDGDLDFALREGRFDVAFLALHGRFGEDGCVQGLLELLALPYTGSGVLASALAADKHKCKQMWRMHNLPTPAGYVLDATTARSVATQHARFGFPVVVKPRGEGSSLGLYLAGDLEELTQAIADAARFDDQLLVERQVRGQEVHVALLGDEVLGAVEIAPADELYRPGARNTLLALPPRLGAERLAGIGRVAQAAARALGTSGLVEVGMIAAEDGADVLLELDTCPALDAASLVARIIHAAGIEYGDLVEAMLDGARLGGRAERPRSDSSSKTDRHPTPTRHAELH